MPIPSSKTEREYDKFIQTPGGNTAVVVANDDGSSIGGTGGTSALDEAAFTPGASSVTPNGLVVDEVATDTVPEGKVGAPRMTEDRKAIHTEYAHTSGGALPYSAISAAAVLSAEIKASPGQVFDIQAFNKTATPVYVRLYNQTGVPATTDTANIVWRGMVPGDTAAAGFSIIFPKAKVFATGIGIRVTAAAADNDATALTANDVMVNLGYK